MLNKINYSWFLKHKKIIVSVLIILISPIALSISSILLEFILKLGQILGTNLRNLSELIYKMI